MLKLEKTIIKYRNKTQIFRIFRTFWPFFDIELTIETMQCNVVKNENQINDLHHEAINTFSESFPLSPTMHEVFICKIKFLFLIKYSDF